MRPRGLEFRLLGPIEAYAAGEPISLGGIKPRTLLAALVLESGHVVPASRLVDLVWRDDPPESVRSLIQTYVSNLRKGFAAYGYSAVIQTRPPGYLVPVGIGIVDVDVFARLVAQAKEATRTGDHGAASRSLREAIALWRGAALSGSENSLLSGESRRLDQLLVSAYEDRFAAELELGELGHLAELTGVVSRHPTNEMLRGQLMTTLYRLGRHADALACYRDGRKTLIEELGIEPGEQLSRLHSAILHGRNDLLHPGGRVANRQIRTVVPAQLPPSPPDFTGHERERRKLAAALSSPSPATQVVAGPGGSGKSTLCVRVAHQVADAFPDGQLYAELRGMSDAPASPGEVLESLLRSLGVDVARIPEATQERMELYRSILADRQMLVILDDAVTEQQVRPLLPGGQRCGVLITSRDRLAGLAGATLTELDMLDEQEAWDLLARIVGDDRLRGDHESAFRILYACGRLPLAIRIAGARLTTRRRLPLKMLADRLTNERQRLDELAVGDLAVRSSIGLSYQALDPQAASALRRMGYFGIPDFSVWVVGWLLEVSEAEAERLLELLVDAQLVDFTGSDCTGVLRYRLHDLVAIYAREDAEAVDPAEVLTASVGHVLHGWLGVINCIAATSPPAEIVWMQSSTSAIELPPDIAERVLQDASGWLRNEESAQVVGVERAAALGLHQAVCDFVSARNAVEQANRFVLRSRILSAALAAARHAGDVNCEGIALVELAQLRCAQDMYAEARQHFGEALARFRATHDVRGQAAALAGLGIVCREPGYLVEALHYLDQAAILLGALDDQRGIGYVHRLRGSVRLEQGDLPGTQSDLELSLHAYEKAGNRRGIAYTLRTFGLYYRAQGEYDKTMSVSAEAEAIFEELGDELMRAYAVRVHAKAQMRLGHGAEALPRLEWALAVARSTDDRWGEAATLRVLGQLHLAEGRLDLAQNCLDAALSMWETMESPLWKARTQHDLSMVYRARGDHEAAQSALTAALTVFHQRGSREYIELGPATTADI